MQKSYIVSLPFALFVLCAVTWSQPVSSGSVKQEPEISLVTDALRAARAALVQGRITWTRTITEEGFLPGRYLTTTGSYECVFLGDQISVSSLEETVNLSQGGATVERASVPLLERWNGTTFFAALDRLGSDMALAPSPRFRSNHNPFTFMFGGKMGRIEEISEHFVCPAAPDGVRRSISVDIAADGAVLIVEYVGEKATIKKRFSLDKGGFLIAEDWIEDGVQSYSYRALVDLLDDVWLPVDISKVTIRNGHPVLTTRFRINKALSTINTAQAGTGAFELVPQAGMEISDYRSGDRINYTLGVDVPADNTAVDTLIEKAKSLLRK